MGIIEIKDNFFENNLINFLHNYFLKIPHYYGHNSNSSSNNFYIHYFDNNNPLINYLCTLIEKNTKILTAYINIQHNNMNGDFHTDSLDKEDITYVFMISKTLQKKSGEFQFLDKENKINSIDFIQNRMIKFLSNIKHRGLAPIEKNIERITLVFKTTKNY